MRKNSSFGKFNASGAKQADAPGFKSLSAQWCRGWQVLLRIGRAIASIPASQNPKSTIQNPKFLLAIGTTIALVAVTSLAQAQLPTAPLPTARPSAGASIQVTPTTPRLGDTITVTARTASTPTPTVTMAGKTYPMFLISGDRYRALLPTTPLNKPGNLPLQVQTVTDHQNFNLRLQGRSFPVQRIWLPPDKNEPLDEREFDQVDAFKQIVSPQKFWNGKFLRPNNGPITTGYGVRRYYNGVFANDYFHRGVDYAGNSGSAIVAPAAGRVALIGYEKNGFNIHGNCVGIDHGQGVASIFLHMRRIDVKVGDFVQAGQQIGTLGNTGASTGPHLHWGLYVHGQSVDPVPWRDRGFE
ncbi:MAG: peptidoglycan DD-metalloendopeptidase family protein [Synechococcales bacterium]|nr:peptidoglycan DD-metalloendopeptidase family protein [Synechococcales bacterium]